MRVKINSKNETLQVVIFDADFQTNHGNITAIQSEYNSTLIVFVTSIGSPGFANLALTLQGPGFPINNKPALIFNFYYERSIQPFISRISPPSGISGIPISITVYIEVFAPILSIISF